jgi:putative ABC transport system permease protein
VGIAGWLAAEGPVEAAASHRIDRFDLPWALIFAEACLAVLTAVAAAWWPARTASRLPVMAALSGRPAPPKPVHRSLLVGVAVTVAGVAGIVAGRPTSRDARPLVLVAGLVGVVLGAVFAAPAAIRVLGPIAGRLPFAPRLALRDLARYQGRAAAALAAITLGLGIAVAVVGIAAANTYDDHEGNLATGEMLVQIPGEQSGPAPEVHESDRARLDAGAAAVARAIGDGATAVPLDFAYGTAPARDANPPAPVDLAVQVTERFFNFVDIPYVATPEVLAAYGIDPAAIDPGIDVLTVHDEPLVLLDHSSGPLRGQTPLAATQLVDLPPQTSAPNSLLTEAAMARNGWVPVRAAWIIESPHALTGEQIRAARAAAVDAGVAIEVRSSQDALATIRATATLVGALLAMAIVTMAVGLMRSEAARDVRTLVATGAPPRARRALTAATAAALALLGVLLGTAGAVIALVAAYHAELDRLVPLPVGNLVALAVGLPLVTAVSGWLLAGAEPPAIARQTLE